MALAQVTIAINQLDAQRIGYQAISLTEFASNLEPKIAAGSLVEVGGALYEAAADEAIAGLGAIAADSDAYIKLTVAGASVTASGTVVAPTWDTAKQGWYNGADRYIGGLYKDAGGNYVQKWLYEFAGVDSLRLYGDGNIGGSSALTVTGGLRTDPAMPAMKEAVIEIGDWNMDATAFVNIAHGLDADKIRHVSIVVRNDDATQYYQSGQWGTDLIFRWGVADITIFRAGGGQFDDPGFNAVGYNRGRITIEYEA